MKILAILIILAGMGVMPYQEPIKHVFDWSYERQICKQAHKYHGILSSHWPIQGEAYFERNGQKCNLLSTIKRWEVVL